MKNSSSSGGGTAPQEKPDVFISFSEEDTGKGFVSHLDAILARHGLTTYKGSNKLGTDDYLSSKLRKAAILDAPLSITVLSRNFVVSPSLLDDLVEILQGSKTKKKMIVPVFYDLEPSTVRKQVGTIGEQFEKYGEMFKDDKVHPWKKALTEAASYSGWDCTVNVRTEHEIAEEIAKDVLQKLDRVYVGDLDVQIDKLEQLARFFQQKISQTHSGNEKNYKLTLERIERLKMEKKLRLLRLTPDLLSHMEISKTTNTYF
ncbi:hypothetical protein QN277_004229 [Acacia crassicarpa]|uniref:ADP-ribosyl cyclase/cyclic ADP-ribose hydrolase n=1 Tax=Acacia crassicarpa TaxID=499986 RepID=A0AAE1J038_9FABA|nr:hypothetical protein QN277_004229 [Acacia crassicarpa]